MPVTPTYPGIYIEELPSNARTITAAPTSIAVFVGYTHPFKTKPENFNKAIQIFNFTEYEREFGGLYTSSVIRNDVAYAINEFFLNGGSVAYVVGLNAQYRDDNGAVIASGSVTLPNGISIIVPPSATIGAGLTGIVFTALEPTDQTSLQVTLRPSTSNSSADIVISYGSRVETYRGVTLDANDANFIEKRLGTIAEPISSLVTVAPASGDYELTFTAAN
ncbi:hypothetical protein [Nostoc sp. WHI]|uniref:hypothetical protein n=1 Tax=Nostoc sp. WHI TaxID=2650611 RepID=UPI0018C84502|nr:hypothetical protein [Nostoc sp. WHI]MBG1270893.1 hypothetical protein [Nostoc sp. WHI]